MSLFVTNVVLCERIIDAPDESHAFIGPLVMYLIPSHTDGEETFVWLPVFLVADICGESRGTYPMELFATDPAGRVWPLARGTQAWDSADPKPTAQLCLDLREIPIPVARWGIYQLSMNLGDAEILRVALPITGVPDE